MARDIDILRLDLRHPPARTQDLRLADVEAVRLVLRGGSPVDWHRLNFGTRDDVDDFLRVNLLDPTERRDLDRLAYLHREALRYLRRNFAFRFPPEVEFPADPRDLFLYASERGRLNRVQILSCVVLKVMFTINHLEARELLLETAISEAELITVVEEQVMRRAELLSRAGLPIVHFFGSRKGRDSMISKLLSKKAARASDILDRLRFRIVTEGYDDLVPTVAHLVTRVFPWNQVTAGESTNKLVDFRSWLEGDTALRRFLTELQVDLGIEHQDGPSGLHPNSYSGGQYRMINFIVDVPVRLDHLLGRAGDPRMLQRGCIVYIPCEFQVVDQETAYLNEQGESSHEKYKRRQRDKVGERLMWGLLRERRGRGDARGGRGARVARMPQSQSALEVDTQSMQAIGDPTPPREIRPPAPWIVRSGLDSDPHLRPSRSDLGFASVADAPWPRSGEEDSLIDAARDWADMPPEDGAEETDDF